MLSRQDVAAIAARVAEMGREHVAGQSIAGLAERVVVEAAELRRADDALMPVLRTALVINWREEAMRLRYDRFRKNYPVINSLALLAKSMADEEPVRFCIEYLDIKASSADNPKYRLLHELVEGFLAYQVHGSLPTEMAALRHWAERVDLKNLRSDPIGRRRGVGPGVVGNLRITLGMDAIKPDRHVIGVVEQVLGLAIPHHRYDELAERLGLGRRYLDEVLFRYGKLRGISG